MISFQKFSLTEVGKRGHFMKRSNFLKSLFAFGFSAIIGSTGAIAGESPDLAAMVKAGTLPPLNERLPEIPLMLPVVDEIGQYGGTLRRAFLGPGDHNNYTRAVYDALVRYAPDGSQIVPHIAAGWESNENFTEWIIRLRPGAKWSDGTPFTADDIMFWYDNILMNQELMPGGVGWMKNADGSMASVQKLSDYLVKWTYKQPNTAFLLNMANLDGADKSISNLVFVPAHYLKQFHPDHISKASLDAKVKAAGFDTWTQLFAVEALPHLSGNRPGMAGWIPDGTTVSDQVFTIKRNPYFVGVDPQGNQLPYIDEIRFTFYADKEALNLAAVAGEIDFQGRHINMSSYPVLKENENNANYRVVTWPTFGGSDAVVMLNQTWTGPEGEYFRNKNFRIALSHAIDRDAIKELAFFGLGEARQGVPAPFHPYYPGDEYAFRYTEFNPEEASAILDKVLPNKNSDGHRLMSNGQVLDIEIGVVPQFGAWTDIAQLIVENWAEVGVKAHMEVRERAQHFSMRPANELMSEVWNEDTTGFPFSGQPKFDPRSDPALTFAPLVAKWYASGGKEGQAPPAEIKRLVDIIDEAKTSGRNRQIALAKELFQIWADNVWEIGTVGMTPMIQGVLVANDKLQNVPAVAGNDWPLRTPGDTRLEQYFYSR
jgi:peptide/nickel transport system substrate-binding protein